MARAFSQANGVTSIRAGHPSLLVAALLAFAASGIAGYMGSERRAVRDAILVGTPPLYNFGSVEQGTRHAHFDLRNCTTKDVDIIFVQPTCTCTDVKLSTRRIGPGETAGLECNWSTQGRRGAFRGSIFVVFKAAGTQDPSFLELSLAATVVPEFTYSPAELAFQRDGPNTIRLRFSSHSPTFRIMRAYANHRAFQAAVRGPEVDVRFEPRLFAGDPGQYYLTVETNCDKDPRLRIPISVERANLPANKTSD